jgi:2-dehydro-3-deoxyphosphogluconate aldolase/(4S)-4-hydroxy-2-oxoglutarate aldolase
MDRKKVTLSLLIQQGILPIYFHPDADISIHILKALYSAGFRLIEYTNFGENAIGNFLQLRKVADEELPGLQLGAGRIINKIQATEFINEGADFIVCPGVKEEVAQLADKNNLLWIPGCLTATEIMLADDLGAQLIKLFPVSLLAPSYLTVMKETFPHLLFMPAGGVETTEEDLNSWFTSGASAVELGVETKNYEGIESLTRHTLQIIQKIKSR